MALGVKFVIGLMALVTAYIGYQTQLLGMYGSGPSGPPSEYNQPTDFAPSEGDCVYAGGYDACSSSMRP
jgi:hypothetical protein